MSKSEKLLDVLLAVVAYYDKRVHPKTPLGNSTQVGGSREGRPNRAVRQEHLVIRDVIELAYSTRNTVFQLI